MCRRGAGWSLRLGCAVFNLSIKEDTIMEENQMEETLLSLLSNCKLCPRECGVNRLSSVHGFCKQGASLFLARAALHFWEEPCISGETGSGTVFFSGCNMQCVFCQNHEIAVSNHGKEVTGERLTEIFLELQEKGANNINLVTPTHFLPQIIISLTAAKNAGLHIPVVYNTSGYEKVESLRLLDGLVDIYLPDFKYVSSELSARMSNAPDYFEVAGKALAEMYHQVGEPIFDEATGLMKKGMIVRHLLLPEQSKDTKKVLRYLHNTFGNSIYISIMNQYTPMPHIAGMEQFMDINRTVTPEEYAKILRFAEALPIDQGFYQEGETQSQSFIPDFSYEGL